MGRKLNLLGQTFGRLTVVAESKEKDPVGTYQWDCICSCGAEKKNVNGSRMKQGLIRSCGCLEAETRLNNVGKKLDLIGQRFGRLLVVREFGISHQKVMWECLCDCGKTTKVASGNLRSGLSKSCGCLKDELTKERFTKHGGTAGRNDGKPSTLEYSVNRALIRRCTDRNQKNWESYGGRGITYDPRWNDHEKFLEDMGRAPSDKHTMERIDKDGNYCKENCKWADRKEQANNTSRNRVVTMDGTTKTLMQWCEHLQLKYGSVQSRLTLGWPEELALKTPFVGRPKLKDLLNN